MYTERVQHFHQLSDHLCKRYQAAPKPENHDPIELVVSQMDSFELRKIGPRQRLILCKMILAKVAYEGVGALSEVEMCLFTMTWERLTSYSDPGWNVTGLKEWFVLEDLVAHLLRKEHWFFGTLNIEKHALFQSRKGNLPTPFAYFGWVKSYKISSYFRRINRRLRRPSPPPAYIGVGYRDSGHRRLPHKDCSPSWQEVAAYGVKHHSKTSKGDSSGFLWSRYAPNGTIPGWNQTVRV